MTLPQCWWPPQILSIGVMASYIFGFMIWWQSDDHDVSKFQMLKSIGSQQKRLNIQHQSKHIYKTSSGLGLQVVSTHLHCSQFYDLLNQNLGKTNFPNDLFQSQIFGKPHHHPWSVHKLLVSITKLQIIRGSTTLFGSGFSCSPPKKKCQMPIPFEFFLVFSDAAFFWSIHSIIPIVHLWFLVSPPCSRMKLFQETAKDGYTRYIFGIGIISLCSWVFSTQICKKHTPW